MGPPCENAKACPVNAVGAGHWPTRRGASAIPEPTLIRLASLGTFPLEAGNTGVDEDSPLRRPHVFPQKQKRRTALFRGRPALFDGCGYFSRPEKNRMNTMAHTAMR